MSDIESTTVVKLRDDARSHDVYSETISDIEASNDSVEKRLAEGRAKRPDSMKNLIFMNHLEIAKVMYCRGDDFPDIQRPVKNAIDGVIERDETENIVKAVYTSVLDVASLAILLKMPGNVFSDLKIIVDRCDKRDQALDHLISHGTQYKEGEAGQSGLWINNNLNRAIDCYEQAGDNCQQYLSDYLTTEWHKEEPTPSNLRNQNTIDTPYQGVYCFPVAALAYINNQDDKELRKSAYYPADIADFARR